MVIYNIIRYFIFLLMVLFLGLFFVDDSQIPYLSKLNNSIKQYYIGLSKQSSDNLNENLFNKMMESDTKYIFQTIDKDITLFLNDLSIDSALQSVLLKEFDDLLFLMSEYLLSNEYFVDLLIYKDKKLFYKYNVKQFRDVFSLNYKQLSFGEIELVFVFKDEMIYQKLNQIEEELYIVIDNKMFTSPHAHDLDTTIEKELISYTNGNTNKITLSNGKSFYLYAYENNMIKQKINVYRSESTQWNLGTFFQLLFICLTIVILGMIVILDRIIFYKIIHYKRYSNRESKIGESSEDNLEWLESFIETENINTKEDQDIKK